VKLLRTECGQRAEPLRRMKDSMSMTKRHRFDNGVVAAGAGLCEVAIALSPDVAAAR
jgi:hypothetical protein